ncbi:MAG: hypothetical protein E7C86_06150 [Paeniclostridium sordellii]|uniref:Lipoprotein n=1 Tax=Paeniclostridium hominis TaxID=2764329 RepID=A0ABR7K7E7_9FIRM|nr:MULTISPECIES: hypothetical protein [Paeniclostridium]MBC6005008.1 hypothetical protein [Paeniclostridium hominis]MDU2592182.1 hypothetical protein [Paeniclostridium sordellii]
MVNKLVVEKQIDKINEVQMKISKKVLALIMTTMIGFAVVGCNRNYNKEDIKSEI